MIKIFVSLGVVGGLIVAYLTVFAVGPISQVPPPVSLLTKFRADGIIPKQVNLKENPVVEAADVFEVPAEDAIMLKKARAAAGSMKMGKGGSMDMSGAGDGPSDDKTKMAGAGTPTMKGADGKPMKMGDAGSTTMATVGSKPMKMGDSGGSSVMAANGGQMNMGEDGLLVTEPGGTYDREITLTMSEWKFSDMNITVKKGERIKFTVKNGGQIPHEFMFMSGPLMQAVVYRQTRADWNLVEHKALFEQALVLPGGDFTFVLQVTKAGSWMFMCMLPYHMEMGMMGQMSTPGAAMKM